jgi:hypothetical protein
MINLSCSWTMFSPSPFMMPYPAGVQYMHTQVPLKTISLLVPLKTLFKIVKIHNIKVSSHVPKDEILKLFDPHVCNSCKLYTMVFATVDSKTERDRKQKHICAGKFQERKEAGQPNGCAPNNEFLLSIVFQNPIRWKKVPVCLITQLTMVFLMVTVRFLSME